MQEHLTPSDSPSSEPDIVLPLNAQHSAVQIWKRVAAKVSEWMGANGIQARDAVVLLPFAQHLTPARRAWMTIGAWSPRIETTRSLASALGPSTLAKPGDISMDPTIDELVARSMLQSHSWAKAMRTNDPRGFETAVARLVETAHALARAAELRSPQDRAQFWEQGREALAQAGPGSLERALALVALEWAALRDAAPATDRLFTLKPAAWVYVQAGGPDPLAHAILAQAREAGVPCLHLSCDIALESADGLEVNDITQGLCADFEDLAQCSAAAVLAHLGQGRAPVALIAHDRVVVRRVHAILDRIGVAMVDETGWKLSTTPEASHLMALLRATRRDAMLDEWIGWLKSPMARSLNAKAGAAALSDLEATSRKHMWTLPEHVSAFRMSPAATQLWLKARDAIEPLMTGGKRLLSEWIEVLRTSLEGMGALEELESMPAGLDVLNAIWLRRTPWPSSAHESAIQGTLMSQGDFIAWIDRCLEASQFTKANQAGADVVVTPLARAMLRPFAAVVLPGADARTLGPVSPPPALLGEAMAAKMGLPDAEQRRLAQAMHFAQLLRSPSLTLLRCRAAGSEPLGPSPLVEMLEAALHRGGRAGITAWSDPRVPVEVASVPSAVAWASTPGLLPAALSASAVEALRTCPYKFFGAVQLGLREVQELDGSTGKRDFGNWLHAVLHQFHTERIAGASEDSDEKLLWAAADHQMRLLGLSPAEFLPFSVSFSRFAPRYLEWLQSQEAQGYKFEAGEVERAVFPWRDQAGELAGELAELPLRGRIDRIDQGPSGRMLVDYKTGNLDRLKDKVKAPLEDTQLAVYAVLMQDGADVAEPLEAQYLALDDGKGIAAVIHEEVNSSASALVSGLGRDLLAIKQGQAMEALGQGSACSFCDMRGLCRRDDWEEKES